MSAYVIPLMWGTMFHTHTKQEAKLYVCIFQFFTSTDNKPDSMVAGIHVFPEINLRLISLWIQFWLVRAVPQYLPHFKVSIS